MSRKTRIIISCILVLFAFGAGIFAYAQTYAGRMKNANAEAVTPEYFVDKFGKIEVPAEPTYNPANPEEEKAVRSSRGTVDNPLFVLEIVPYDGMAEFGFMVAGQEPIDVDAAARDGVEFPGKDNFYNKTNKTFYFWKSEKPITFKDPTQDKMTQYGTMKYVGPDGGGQYNRSDLVEVDGHVTGATYTPVANGEFAWEPLSVEECLALTEAEKDFYDDAYQDAVNVGDTFLMSFPEVDYVYKTGEVLEHKNVFLRESVGLAYEYDANGKRDYVRKADGSIDEDAINERIANYYTTVYTVTPEDLNLNPELVERADLIVISTKAKMGSGFCTVIADGDTLTDGSGNVKSEYKHIPYLKKDKIGYEEPNGTYGRKYNLPGANYSTNLIDWNVVLKIYERATDPVRICPVVVDHLVYNDTKGASGNELSNTVTLKKMLQDQTTPVTQNIVGTQNNMAKLFLLMYQMTNPVLESFYGEVSTTDHAMFGSTDMTTSTGSKIAMKNGAYLKTGTFLYDKNWPASEKGSEDSRKYWSDLTLLPWSIMPVKDVANNTLSHSNVADYGKIFATYGIMCENSETYKNNITSGDSKDSIRNGLMQYNGDTKMSYGFDSQDCAVKNNEYGSELYDFFSSITKESELPVEEGDLTSADCLYYLLNGLNLPDSVVNNNKIYKVLELQPSPDYENVNTFWKPLIAAYTNSVKEPAITQMTTSEFIGSHVECISDFDLVYIGMNKLSSDMTMKFSSGTDYVYAHTGPGITVVEPFRALYGWLGTSEEAREKSFVFSGNDLTQSALNKLKEYDLAQFPILFADGFFTGADAGTVVSTIDRNSNIYQIGSTASHSVYVGALPSVQSKRDELRKALTVNSKKVELIFATANDSPVIYDTSKSEADRYINGHNNANRTLRFKFTVKAPAGTSYDVKLYVDSNTDGVYKTGEEDVGAFVYKVDEYGNESSWSGSLEAGKTYVVKRTITDRIGSICWKLALVKENKVYASLSGVSAIQAKADGSEDKTIYVLQIVPKSAKDSVKLPTSQAEADSLGGASKLFYEKIKDINGMNISFKQMNETEIVNAIVGAGGTPAHPENPDYLYDTYDMLVLGFADTYDGVSDTLLLEKIEEFISYGKAVLYTHDTSSGIGENLSSTDSSTFPRWGTNVTRRYRDLFGMDRYGAREYITSGSIPAGKDIPYEPLNTTTDYTKIHKNTFGQSLIQGVANGMLYRTMYPSMYTAGDQDANVNSTKVSRVNQGAITEYPYNIPKEITVASTHPQYYQLDMETEDIVVWYCLADDNSAQTYEKKYFSVTPNDVRNNYYIYNIGNVTYSGMGHIAWYESELDIAVCEKEIELFVNTFVAAYRAAAQPVKVEIKNDDVTSNSAGEYFLCVDVDSSDPDEIIGNDIVGTYRLQEDDDDGTGYKEGAEVTKRSKRVYFRLIDNNSYGGAEYALKIVLNDGTELDGVKVDGENEMFAVYRKDTGTFVDTQVEEYRANTDYWYYVDVPITLEMADAGKVVGKTELKMAVTMTYKIGIKEFTVPVNPDVPEWTKVHIMPRGLFDLD